MHGPKRPFLSILVYILHILDCLGQDMQVLYLGRAPRTKETLPDFLKWHRVTRPPLVFHGLTGSQRTPRVLGRHSTCRTTKHLVGLYQASMKGKDKQIETNFIDGKDTMGSDDPFFDDDGAVPLKHFDVYDFFDDPSGKIYHLIGDDNMCYN